MREMFPVLAKWPVLLPFAWAYRIVDVLLHRRQNVARMASVKISKDDVAYVTQMERSFGLEPA